MLKITSNSIVNLLVFLKINFNWALDDGRGNLNVKIGENEHAKIPDNSLNVSIMCQ